jgi:hypothetical protein
VSPSRVRKIVERRIHWLDDRIAERVGTELPYRLFENEKLALESVLAVYNKAHPPFTSPEADEHGR